MTGSAAWLATQTLARRISTDWRNAERCSPTHIAQLPYATRLVFPRSPDYARVQLAFMTTASNGRSSSLTSSPFLDISSGTDIKCSEAERFTIICPGLIVPPTGTSISNNDLMGTINRNYMPAKILPISTSPPASHLTS